MSSQTDVGRILYQAVCYRNTRYRLTRQTESVQESVFRTPSTRITLPIWMDINCLHVRKWPHRRRQKCFSITTIVTIKIRFITLCWVKIIKLSPSVNVFGDISVSSVLASRQIVNHYFPDIPNSLAFVCLFLAVQPLNL